MIRITPSRVAVGFAAGFASVLIFSMSAIAVYQAAGAMVPVAPWSMMPVPPLGVPQSISAAFWGGLWGIAYALLEPTLTARLGRWPGGLAFGALPLLGLWFVALPLKGLPVGGGFAPAMVIQGIVLHAAFALGLAVFFRLGQYLLDRKGSLSPT